MKKNIFILLLVMNVSCKEKSQTIAIEEPLPVAENFDWLIGNWQRTNEQENRETFETWKKDSDTLYTGFGFTLENNDTIWQETVSLVKEDDNWNFEVTGDNEVESTDFVLTKIEENMFTCENQENEFPKIISYRKGENGITALISGGDMEIPFEFKRIK